MADTFVDLGLRSELDEVVRVAGYEAPSALQRASIPVLRRGGNAILHASAGAGVVGAYGLALLDRLAGSEAEGPRALVLVATDQAAVRTAESLARFARAVGLRVVATGAGWPGVEPADVVVTTPASALGAVEASALKLDAVEALVLDGLSAMFELGGKDAVETLVGLVPRDAQRVVVTSSLDREVEDHVERHVRKALRIPPVPVEEEAAVPAEEPTPVRYAVVAGADKGAALAVLLGDRDGRVHVRTARRRSDVLESLELRGFDVEEQGDALVVRGIEEGEELVVSYDVPMDEGTLAARHGDGGIILVEARELAHLRLIARRANFVLRAVEVPLPAPAADEVAGFRERVRRALSEEDLGAQLLVLAPLFEEVSPAEVAAALAALLRRREPATAAPVAEAAQPTPLARRPAAPAGAPAVPTYARLFVGAGSRDEIRPGDLVGAITGETGARGDQVGRIEIRDNFSIVEVSAEIADQVIRALNGTTLKGRSLRVDYDRRPSGARGAGERPRRRIVRRPGE